MGHVVPDFLRSRHVGRPDGIVGDQRRRQSRMWSLRSMSGWPRMKLSATLRTSILMAAMTMTWMAAPAGATDVDPGDYTALPPGTNMFLIYGQHIHRDELRTPDGATLKSGTSLDTSVTLLRYVHFTKLGPFVVDPQIILPIGSVHNARVGGQGLGKDTGLGDALIFATIW